MRGEWFQIDWHIVRHVGDLVLAGGTEAASAIIADLEEWHRLAPLDFSGSIAALRRAYRRGLPIVNEWDVVFLEGAD